MKRLTVRIVTIGLVSPLLLSVVAGHTQAGTILINFEQYSNGHNLHGVNLGGVTLTNRSGKVEIYENRFGVGSHSGTKAVASSAGLVSVNPLVGVFDSPVSSMSLWGGDAGTYLEADSWELRAFDARGGGNLVGQASSGSWNGSPYRQLSISGPEIWRFEAYWTGPTFGIGYDDLQFATTAPPPPPDDDPDPDYDPDSPPDTAEPSNGSFDGSLDQDVLTVTFDDLQVGDPAYFEPFSVWNLPSTGPTADLNFVDLVVSGDSDVFTTDLALFSGLAATDSLSFAASIDTSTPGEFSATYELSVSDATGTPQAPLRIVFSGSVVPEPSTFALAVVGLLSLLAWGGWRRKAG